MNAEKLIACLDGVRKTGSDRWVARCPAHEDKSPSLSIRETQDGTVLIKCFAGCGAADVVNAVGLELSDLFLNKPAHHRKGEKPNHWHARGEALKTLQTESLIVALAGGVIQRGDRLTDEDQERLSLAVFRIRHAVEACLRILSNAHLLKSLSKNGP